MTLLGKIIFYLLMNSMATVAFNHREAMSLSMFLNYVSNFSVFYTRLHCKKLNEHVVKCTVIVIPSLTLIYCIILCQEGHKPVRNNTIFIIQLCFEGVQIMRKTSANITKYLYSSHSLECAKDKNPPWPTTTPTPTHTPI